MIAAVIPTRFHPPELAQLVAECYRDEVTPYVMESALFDHRIHRMWNAGTEMAKAAGAQTVAILNDDISIVPGTLRRLDALLGYARRNNRKTAVVYPDVQAPWGLLPDLYLVDPTEGTWGRGGMTGFCFMFRTDLPLPAFDEGFGLWYGDDAFEEGVRAAGYNVCRAVDVPIHHIPGGSTDPSEWGPIIEADRTRWDALHA